MLLYSKTLSARLQYICKTIFNEKLALTNNISEAKSYNGLVINYSNSKEFVNELHIQPINLLFEETVEIQKIECFKWNDVVAFFKTSDGIGFDILAASFYLISRYEEYLIAEVDEHHSFSYKSSIAYKENFLDLPLINIWWNLVQEQNPAIQLPKTSFKFISSFDVDIAYKYQHHSNFKNCLSTIKSFFKLDFLSIKERWKHAKKNTVLKDPYDVFNWLNEMHLKYKVDCIYFCLSQTKRSKYDVNLSTKSKGLRDLYKSFVDIATIGIHPSYNAGVQQLKGKQQLLQKEIESLKTIIQKPIRIARQHYLVMQLPNTYLTLIEQKITDDYSMGYNYVNGFRASYCKPFYWFNLLANESTTLMIHPFVAMDSNFIFSKDFNLNSATNDLQSFHQIIKENDGEMIIIFHNHFNQINSNNHNWNALYENFLAFVDDSKKIKH